VDELLRRHVLVDHFQVVRQPLRISVPSYSLKRAEELYFPPRETDVLDVTHRGSLDDPRT
jgi:predicted RecB family nuclease